jgi:hypothetical protein
MADQDIVSFRCHWASGEKSCPERSDPSSSNSFNKISPCYTFLPGFLFSHDFTSIHGAIELMAVQRFKDQEAAMIRSKKEIIMVPA